MMGQHYKPVMPSMKPLQQTKNLESFFYKKVYGMNRDFKGVTSIMSKTKWYCNKTIAKWKT